MSSHEGTDPNPYQQYAEILREALADPAVNITEHERYFPSLQGLLPSPGLPFTQGRVRRVLDFGCGPGNFTHQIAAAYPAATVLGVDAVEGMLPEQSSNKRVSFRQWNGFEPLDEPLFNVIVAKLVFQYLSPQELEQVVPNLTALLTPRGVLAVSVPLIGVEAEAHETPKRLFTVKVRRQIGQTGISAVMWSQPTHTWLARVLRLTPPSFVAIRENITNAEGELKRLNFLLCQRGKSCISVLGNLKRTAQITDSTPARVLAEITETLSDELRNIANALWQEGRI